MFHATPTHAAPDTTHDGRLTMTAARPAMSASLRRRMKGATVAGFSVLVTLGAAVVLGSNAQAIPTYQRHCALDFRSNVTWLGWQPVASSVRVNNGNASRHVVVNFNADANVDTGAEIRIAYRIDAGRLITPGAEHFAAAHTPHQQTRHSMVVLFVPRGWHTIRPYWRIVGPTGKRGYIDNRCLTAEAHTS